MPKRIHNYEYELKGTLNGRGENLSLDIEYTYEPKQHATKFDPPEDERVEIETISLFGHDMSEWLDNQGFDVEGLEHEILEAHSDE